MGHVFAWLIAFLLLIVGCGGGRDDGGGRVSSGDHDADDDGDDDGGSGDDDGDDDGGGDDDNDDDDDDGGDDDTEIAWVTIPAGTFVMGCSPGDTDCEDHENPPRTVILTHSFQMAATETTQAQYAAVMSSNPSHFASCGGNCPVEMVSWDDANSFCEAVGGRLPAEAEWEYAACAGTTTRFYCGDDEACLEDNAWYGVLIEDGGMPHDVGSKSPNAFGLYDTMGNVGEWVNDWYGEFYYAGRTSPDTDPPGTWVRGFKSLAQ